VLDPFVVAKVPLGHRTAESTSMYLRLATGDLREVALAVPGSPHSGKERKC
jgi:hypothetical protein